MEWLRLLISPVVPGESGGARLLHPAQVRADALHVSTTQHKAAQSDLVDLPRRPSDVPDAPPDDARISAADTVRRLTAARAAVARTEKARSIRWSFGSWLNRSRRVLLAVAGIWVLGAFDLLFTVAEWGGHNFVEVNPLARHLLDRSDNMIAVFKFGLLGVASVILLLLRRTTIAERAAWFLLAAQFYVAVRWFVYYDCTVRGMSNPLVEY